MIYNATLTESSKTINEAKPKKVKFKDVVIEDERVKFE